eukprot:Skav214276  [mRNA]  locus=scaffold642:392233:396459:- [translate_table: standard]
MDVPLWAQMMLSNEAFTGFEESKTTQIDPKHVLLKDVPEMSKGDLVQVTVVQPAGCPTTAAMRDFLMWEEERPIKQVTILWDSDLPCQSADMTWILDCTFSSTPTSPWVVRVTDDSTQVVVNKGFGDCLHVLECFSGGYGGWHFALQHLNKCFGLPCKVVAIESDIAACCSFAIHHQLPIHNGFTCLKDSFFEELDTSCVLHADATGRSRLAAAGSWHVNCMCISAPCPPWSGAGEASGLHCSEGMLFPESLMQAKWLQPELIVIEQVAAFQHHAHKQRIFQTMRSIGYIHVWSRVVDLACCTPVKRPRWLAVFRRHDVAQVDFDPYVGLADPNQTPRKFDAVLPTDQCDADLFLSEQVKALLSEPAFAPKPKRPRNPAEILKGRTYTEHDQLPVFMASYASQHTFSEDRLKQFGCFAHVLKQDDRLRFWSPLEVCLLHFAIKAVFIPKSMPIAFRYLGNQIATPHAMTALCHGLKAVGIIKVDMHAVLETLQAHRLKVSNITIRNGPLGDLIVHDDVNFVFPAEHHEHIEQLLRSCAKGHLPDNMWWDIFGFHELVDPIPSSIPANQLELWEPLSPAESTAQLSEEEPIPNTLIYRPTVRLTLDFPLEQQLFWVACDVAPSSLPSLWMGMLVVSEMNQEFLMRYKPNHVEFLSDDHLIAFLDANQVTIYQVGEDCKTVAQLQTLVDCTWLYDPFGPLQAQDPFDRHTLVTTFQMLHSSKELSLPFLLAAFQSAQVIYRYDPLHDIWFVEIIGEDTPKITLASFFAQAIHESSLKMLGRTVHVIHDLHTRVEFWAAYQTTPVPPKLLSKCVAVATMRAILDQTKVPQGRHMRIKWAGRFVWEGFIDPLLQIETLTTLLMRGLSPCTRFAEMRCVVQGKQYAVGTIADIRCSTPMMTMHLIEEMWGGGGPTSTKGQLKQQTRNGLAGVLLEQGVDLDWIKEHVELLIDKAGVPRLIPILSQPPSVRKDSQVKQIFADFNMPLPAHPTRGSNAPQIMRTKQKRRGVVVPNPKNYTIDCNVLTCEDGSHATQLSEFGPNVSGVYLTDGTEALHWSRTNQLVSTDELAMLLIGRMPCETSLQHEEVVIPCWDQQQHPVLMQATMIQFGSKKVTVQKLDKKEFDHASSKVVAFTWWRQDWPDDQWQAILSNTNQFLKDSFTQKGMKDCIVSSWGRSLRNGRTPSTVHKATSVQVHAAIPEKLFMQVLQKSGFNKIWASPKNEQGRISEDFRMIWIDGSSDLQQLSVQLAPLSGIAGIARGKSTLGVRVQVSHFEGAWKVLKPGEPVPSKIMSKHVYKIEPLPYACNPKALGEWGDHIGWNIRPLRAAGPRAWIVGTEVPAPDKQLSFNGQLVLPTLLPPKQSISVSPILAGPRATPMKKSDANHTPLQSDDWANYIRTNGSSGISASGTAAPV